MRALLATPLAAAALAVASCGGGAPPPAAAPEAPAPAPAAPPPAAASEAPAPASPAPPALTDTEPAPGAEPPAPPAETAAPEALPGLPAFTAGYESWPLLNEDPIPPREQGDPHLGTKSVYASEQRGPDGLYPVGAIVVKEAARPGADFIGLVATMRKVEGADPDHGDWVFAEYTRSGPDERFGLTAKDAVCWSCHAGAAGTDYVWVHTLGLAP